MIKVLVNNPITVQVYVKTLGSLTPLRDSNITAKLYTPEANLEVQSVDLYGSDTKGEFFVLNLSASSLSTLGVYDLVVGSGQYTQSVALFETLPLSKRHLAAHDNCETPECANTLISTLKYYITLGGVPNE